MVSPHAQTVLRDVDTSKNPGKGPMTGGGESSARKNHLHEKGQKVYRKAQCAPFQPLTQSKKLETQKTSREEKTTYYLGGDISWMSWGFERARFIA